MNRALILRYEHPPGHIFYTLSNLILTYIHIYIYIYLIWQIFVKLLWHGFAIRKACNNIWLFHRGSGDNFIATCNVIYFTMFFVSSHNWFIYFICLTHEEKNATSRMVAPPSWKKDLSWCWLAWSREGHFQNTLDAQGKTMLETGRWPCFQGEYPGHLIKIQKEILINIFREVGRRRLSKYLDYISRLQLKWLLFRIWWNCLL